MRKRRIPIYLLALVNVAVVLGLWFTGFADRLDPLLFGWLSLGGYAFPMMLLLTVTFMALWVFIKKRYILLSVVGLLVAYHPVTLYCPINISTEVPDDAFEVISFNTHYYGKGETEGDPEMYAARGNDANGRNIVLDYLASSNADVLALQEASNLYQMEKECEMILVPKYEYRDSVHGEKGGAVQWLYSKYPIVRKENIPIETKGNIVAAFWVRVKGREMIVVNCHLQTTGLSVSDREKFSSMMHGYQETDTMKQTSKTIFGKLLEASKIRVTQANAVASFVRMHSGTPIIVCGDFNDIPQSYVHHVIEEGMTDCYKATAKGPGFTFSQYGMRVRIDNMLCTPELVPYNCYTDYSIDVSDHYPVRCWFDFAN